MSFTYPASATEPFDFSKILGNSFPAQYAQEVNMRREHMAALFISQPGSQPLIDCIEAYLPYLIHLTELLERQEKDKKGKNFRFVWRAVLSKGIVKGLIGSTIEKPMVRCESLWYELHGVLLSYAYCLVNMANRICHAWEGNIPVLPFLINTEASLSSSESGETIPSIGSIGDISHQSNNFQTAAHLLCRAAGIFETLSSVISPRWRSPPADRPPECNPVILMCLSKICIADSDRLVALQGIAKGMRSTLITKILISSSAGYLEAARLLKGPGISKNDHEELGNPIIAYILKGRMMLEGLIWTRIARFQAREYPTNSETTPSNGIAIACYLQSIALLEDFGKNNGEFPPYKINIMSVLNALLREKEYIVRINNNVTYQPVPSIQSLLTNKLVLPDPQSISKSKPFTLPDPIVPTTPPETPDTS